MIPNLSLIDYRAVKYDYLMSVDFETDLIDGKLRFSQFGAAGSYLDTDFGYYHSKHSETDSVEKIFFMAETWPTITTIQIYITNIYMITCVIMTASVVTKKKSYNLIVLMDVMVVV